MFENNILFPQSESKPPAGWILAAEPPAQTWVVSGKPLIPSQDLAMLYITLIKT